MQLPIHLQEAMDRLLHQVSLEKLKRASETLSQDYREGKSSSSLFQTQEGLLAYLIVRMPATFAAVRRALQEVPGPIRSLLDVGAGPGTASWAALDCFPELSSLRLVEKSRNALQIARELAPFEGIEYETGDLASVSCKGEDLTLLSYVLTESFSSSVLQEWKERGGNFLLVVEPGTPRGYENILKVRSWALDPASSLWVAAPCPHSFECPMKGTSQWCHFSERVERSRAHRRIKGGTLGYEDEKFSYLLLSKQNLERPKARIVGHPRQEKGRLRLSLCTQGKIEEKVILQREEEFKVAKKLEWGDPM